MSDLARIAYIVHAKHPEPPKLLRGSRFRVLEPERAPYVAPLLALEDELGRTTEETPLDEVAHRFSHRHLLLGEGPAAGLLADAAAALEAAFAAEAEGFVEDLFTGRLIPALDARNHLPGRLAAFLRVERHVALAPFAGGLMTRGLGKLGGDEVAILCGEALHGAAAAALRRLVREVLLSGRLIAPAERREAGGLAFVARPVTPEDAAFADARAALSAHRAAVAARLPEGFTSPGGLLALDLVDASGAPATEALLAAIPEAERAKLRAPPAAAKEDLETTRRMARAGAPAATDEDRGEATEETEGDEGGAEEEGEAPAQGSGGETPAPAAATAPSASDVFARFAALSGDGADVAGLMRAAPGRAPDGTPFTTQVEPAGTLGALSGELVACDPLTEMLLEPLPVRVSPGAYAVYVAIARFADGDQRIAAAAVLLSSEPPVALERAHSYAVGSGAGCFVDRALAVALSSSEQQAIAAGEAISAALAKGRVAVLGLRAKKRKGPDPSIVAFQAGFGDGVYATWVARDAEGRPVAAITGFGILEGDVPREGDRTAGKKEPERRGVPQSVLTLDTLLHMVNVDRRMGNDYSDLATLLVPEAELIRRGLPGGDARGRDAIVLSFAETPLSDELAFEMIVAEASDTQAAARFAWKATPEKLAGVVRATFEGELVTRIEIQVAG